MAKIILALLLLPVIAKECRRDVGESLARESVLLQHTRSKISQKQSEGCDPRCLQSFQDAGGCSALNDNRFEEAFEIMFSEALSTCSLDLCESELFGHCSPQAAGEEFCKECTAKFADAGGCELIAQITTNESHHEAIEAQLLSWIPDGCWSCGQEAADHCAHAEQSPVIIPSDCSACISILDKDSPESGVDPCTFVWGENPEVVMPERCIGMGQACAEKIAAHCAEGSMEECRTVRKGDGCFEHVRWAMTTGISFQPSWYSGLTRQSTFEDFQMLLHLRKQHGCPAPCQNLPPSFCHTSRPGEECYGHVIWAKEVGIQTMPKIYPSVLTVNSSFVEFQEWLHHIRHGDCQAPCTEAVPM